MHSLPNKLVWWKTIVLKGCFSGCGAGEDLAWVPPVILRCAKRMCLSTFTKQSQWAIFRKGPATVDCMTSYNMRRRWKWILSRALEWLVPALFVWIPVQRQTSEDMGLVTLCFTNHDTAHTKHVKAVDIFSKARLDGVSAQFLWHRVLFTWHAVPFTASGNATVFNTSDKFLIQCKYLLQKLVLSLNKPEFYFIGRFVTNTVCGYFARIFQWISFEKFFCIEWLS